MFDKDLKIELMKFTQFVTTNLVPLYEQKTRGEGKNFFCEDWWNIEVLKFLFNGKSMYLEDPPPWRLIGNKNFSKQEIIDDGEKRIAMFKTLEEVKDSTDNILFCEVGRGIDIILANWIKKWKRILCYDENPHCGEYIKTFFKEKLKINAEFVQANTGGYPFEDVNEPTILIANHGMEKTGFGDMFIKRVSANKNFVKIIRNGVLI